ncbi:MAG TPA: MFS transporter [Actinomycetota bacterium]|nr:MFS transporter [Actinomycetota bacterium]
MLSGDFGRFWLGQTISNLGSSFTMFALPLLVFNLTGSPVNLGITTAAEFVPYLLFGLVIGAWVDRVDRRRLMIATIPLLAALGALLLDGLLTVALATTRWYWAALVLWAAILGLGMFFNINTSSLRQQIVPNHLLGRVISIAGVLAWSAIPVGALAGGWAIERSGSVALVYGVIGALVALLAIAFSFGPVGHADRYLPAGQDAQRS